MIRTFGLGPRVKQCLFGRFGSDLRPKTSVNPRGIVKTVRWEQCPFSDLFWSMDGYIVPKTESVC